MGGRQKTRPRYFLLQVDIGVMKYNNGEVYDGRWIEDKREGKGNFSLKSAGVMNYEDGTKYDGEWKNDQKAAKSTRAQ